MLLKTSPTMPLSCFFIGQDNLLIECATRIQAKQWRILGVISPSNQVKSWAQSHAIPWFSALPEVDWDVYSVDYLFSIVNDEIIPETVLSKIRQLAINYHDGPLPRYAGSNATSWAILHGEAQHAITWHIISEKIDGGDLLKQRTFALQADETALSLNLQCAEHAIATFAELLDELINGTCQRSPQQISLRSYFSRAHKPVNNGWINWNSEAEQLARLVRATQFGPYRNPFSVAKILVRNQVLIVEALTVLTDDSVQAPGTLVDITPAHWVVATQTKNVKISALSSPRAKLVEDLETFADQHQLCLGMRLPLTKQDQPNQQNHQNQEDYGELLKEFSEATFCHESLWIEKLSQFQPTTVTSQQANIDLSDLPLTLHRRITKFSHCGEPASVLVLTAWLIYLRRIEAQTQLAISVAWNHFDLPHNLPDEWSKFVAPFFANFLPITVSIDDQDNFYQTLNHVRIALEEIRQQGSYLIDCWTRYPELAERRAQATGYQITAGLIRVQAEGIANVLPTPFLTLLDALLTHAHQPTGQVPWITPTERTQLLIDWNTTNASYPDHQTIHRLFEVQVEKTPDQIALIAPGIRLTYTQLNQRANQLASYLLTHYAICPDQLVAVCLERSEWMLIALLGILKSGAGYVPIDPTYPDNRIRFIADETQVRVFITTQGYGQRLLDLWEPEIENHAVIILDGNEFHSVLHQQSKQNPTTEVLSTHLAYVMYTSGTTGTPKGIPIEHRSIVNRISWMNHTYPLTSTDRVLQKTPFVFDVSVWELFWAHWTGAAIVFTKPDGHRNLQYLAKLIDDEDISIVHFTPTMLNGFVQAVTNEAKASTPLSEQFKMLRHLFCSGEVLHDLTVAKARALMPKVRIHNLYGPTEAAIDVLYYECIDHQPVCLGKPIANTRVYVLDDQRRLVPAGIAGELYLAGDGLARGYLNQPALTSQQFIDNPFLTKQEQKRKRFNRLYKTGDLVRWLPSGDIAYIGRVDRQVKLRGNRIELGEIEQVIQRHPSIMQCAVMVTDNHLVAYYTTSQAVEVATIQLHAADWLPDYMIPNHWLCVDTLPTGISGKVDYQQLAHPGDATSRQISPARNVIEMTVVMVFAAVLGLESASISITDDFFQLGGDSILAIRLVARINELLSRRLQVRQVFELKTPQALSAYMEQTEQVVLAPEIPYQPFSLVELSHYQDLLSQYDIEDIYPASRLQIGMLLESSLNDYGTYHDVFYYEIKRPFVEPDFLQIWQALANKHALLRARFFLSDQHALDVVIFSQAQLHYRFYVDQPLQALIDAERLVHFAHTEECLFHLLVNQHGDKFDLIFSFHHAIVDGWSIASLINEFVQAYVYGKAIVCAPSTQPRLTYGEFVRNELNHLDDQDSITFWKDYLEGSKPTQANWKFDDTATSPDSLFTVEFYLTPEEAKQTLQLARYHAISVDTVFLYAYLKALSFFINSDDITIGVVFNNRLEKIGGDALFGLFLNVLPFRQKLERDQNLPEALLATFSNKIKLLAHRHIPYAQLKSMLRHDLYRFGFNFINFHVLSQSQSAIGRQGGFDRTSIPLMLEVTQADTFKIVLKSHDNYVSQEYLNYFMRYLKLALQNTLHGQNKLTLDMHDYQKMIVEWNATVHPYCQEKTLHQLFEEQVERTPNSVALVIKETTLTYLELNQRANQLANYLLIRHQVKPDDLIALFLDRNEWMLIAILGVLKSGAAYLPIEPGYPDERTKYILNETETKVVLTNVRYQKRLQDYRLTNFIVSLDSEHSQNLFFGQSAVNPRSAVTSTNLAYVIYTSGTTGKPNGVMIEHRSVINVLSAMYPVYQCPKNRRATAYTSYVFDVSVAEIFTVLTAGSELYLLDQERNDVNQLSAYLLKHKINIAYLPPAILSVLTKITYPELHVLIFAGEPCSAAVAEFWALNYALYNYYGPTEFTIYAAGRRVDKNINNIGAPIFNNQAFVLNHAGAPLPIGAVGELYLAGDGVARGYFKNESLSKEKFSNVTIDSASTSETKKLYKTGDFVRWLPSGELEFIGRNDSQVKINGYRIELAEIEHALNNFPGMKHSVVVVQEQSFKNLQNPSANKYLVGYYLLDSAIQDGDQYNCISNWKQLYDAEYADLNIRDFQDNIAGWKSSYTGNPFSKEEMREWKDEVVEKIRRLNPKRIVEIGSGTGMLLFSLVTHCDYYFASDLSERAVQYMRDASHRLGLQDKVTLFAGDAKSLPFFSLNGKFDTAILNSVIQYFPTLDYLDEVINALIENTELPGQIFIGDVRDARLLNCFKCSVLKSKNSPIRRRHEIDYFVSCEKELVVAPGYFVNLKNKDQRISHVEILPKLGIFSNEMNAYRYDVVLHIGEDSVPTLAVEMENMIELNDLAHYLSQSPRDLIAFRYPNKKILRDYKEYSRIYHLPFEFDDQDINEILTSDQVEIMLRQHGYDCQFYSTIVSPYRLDIIAYRPEKVGNLRPKLIANIEQSNVAEYTNSRFLNARLVRDKNDIAIKNYLKSQLPEYMIPNYLFPLTNLPTTPGGKLDRTALPNPEVLITETYFAPRNKFEVNICQLFSEVLSLPLSKIGIKSSFFDMGGNSLSAIVLASKLSRSFSVDLKISDIFKHKNVERLSELVTSLKVELPH